MASNKEAYIQYCSQNEDKIPLFFNPFWLDTVCYKGSWDVLIPSDLKDGENAFLVYFLTKKYGQQIITMPPLTPFSGLVLDNQNDQKAINSSKWESRVTEQLVAQLPKNITYYNQSMYYKYQNWLPYYWKAFQQTTRYSYVIEDLSTWSIEDAASNIRNKIAKANKLLTISEIDDVDVVYRLVKTVFENKNINMPFEIDMLENLDAHLKSIDRRKIYISKDDEGNIHAAIYIVYDKENVYNLMLGSDPYHRQSGAVPQLLNHAIEKAKTIVNRFDFEGSMLLSLNDLFSGFGGTRKAYLRIYKTKNWLWDILYRLKDRNDQNNR